MTYEEQIRLFGSEVEYELNVVWDILVKFKEHNKQPEFKPEELLNFQINLTKIQYSVTQKYFEFSYRRKGLEKEKKKLGHKKFEEERERLTKILKFLQHLLVIGKSFGDAFVYIFYSLDREYLNQQLQSAPQSSLTLPRGIGGIGEFEFLKKVKTIDNHFIIYHGITDMLRIGDFTLFDLRNGKVVGIGELKSGKFDESTLTMNLTVIGPKKRNNNFNNLKNSIPEINYEKRKWIDEERYKKQVDKMINSFNYLKKDQSNDERLKVFNTPKYNHIDDLGKLALEDRFSHRQISNTQLLCRFSYYGESLYDKFNCNEVDVSKCNFEQIICDIIMPEIENSIQFGHIHLNVNVRIQQIAGTKPLFWEPITIDVLKKIYFGEIHFFTLYNPGNFFNEMTKLGFKYEYNDRHKSNGLTKKDNEGVVTFISGVDYFLKLITNYLQDESLIISSIENGYISGSVLAIKKGQSVKAEFNIVVN